MLVIRSDGLCYDNSYNYTKIFKWKKYTYNEIQMMGKMGRGPSRTPP